jgi:hypothetical protein
MADGLLGGIGDALGGAGDFLLGRGRYADATAINPQYGVPETDVRQAGINTLANVSALLLAAGQPMSGQQRAQLIAGIGPAMGGITTDIYKASQSRLMLAQQQQAQQEMQELAAVRREMQDPAAFETKYGFKPLPSAADNRQVLRQKTIADYAISPEEKQKRQLEVQRLQQQIEEGNYITAGNVIYKKEGGKLVRMTPYPDYGIGEGGAPAAGGVPTAPEAARPPGAPPVAKTGEAATPHPFATINRNLDYNRAFGLSGAYNWAAGKARGVFGSEDKSTQEAGKAISEVDTLRNSLIAATAAEVAGKNLKSTQARIGELLPSAAAVFTSPAEAVNKLSSVKSLIESDMNDLRYIVSETSQASPADKTKAAQAFRDLRRNRDNINVVIDSLTAGKTPEAGATPTTTAAPSRFREGQTAVNPQTGARVIFRNGRWEAM